MSKGESGKWKGEEGGAEPSPPAPPFPDSNRVAGIDYGTVRIGIAIGDLEVSMASPYENYNRRSERLDAQYFKQLANEERLARWVVGLPVHLNGDESQKSLEARQFGRWLIELTGVPVDYFDERYTSAHAEEILQAANLTKKKRQARLDALAAQIMLTAYLESGGSGDDNPGSIG
ncbi:putative Holliday junction resolvase [Posidoniimonas polymericola]|uniref:Putative pre-16S rRNA nuclease n=1 Tax=Posidoniimonas polymericola TaxID=2528002 RepID=A0A5C5YS26_9BACT|nr:Holliday junction resolvase RuvX [Posidoniimonas polymericola]TWT77752.1 putative Holliday junction resolvase [Posidoniimonas polymericola]